MPSLALAFEILAKDSASKQFDKVGDSAERLSKKGSGIGPGLKAGFAVGAVAVAAFAKSSISAFIEAEDSSARLDDALKKFPPTADKSRASFDQLNASLATKTKFDDDATASGQAVLAQFKLTGTQIQTLTPLLQDYAAKTGKSLPEAAAVLGKATLGNGRALKEIGLNFKNTGTAAGNFAELQKGLSAQVGGFAQNEGKTAAGQAEILKNQFGELQEKVGSKLVPILKILAEKLIGVVGFISQNSAVIVPLVTIIGSAAAAFFLVTKAIGITNVVLKALGKAEIEALGPVGLIIIGIAALAAGLVYAYNKSETFRKIVGGALEFVKSVASTVFHFFKNNWPLLLGILTGPFGLAVLFITKHRDKIVEVFKAVPRLISRAVSGAFDGLVSGFKGAVNTIIRAYNGLEFKFGGQTIFGQKLPGVTIGTPDIPLLATGGLIKGLGTGTSDSILARVSNGEFVVNAAATRRNLGQLQALNRGEAAAGGLHIHGDINVVSGPGEDAAEAVPRRLRNLAFTMGV